VSETTSRTQESVAAPFWSALSEGRLVLPYCQACQRAFFYPRARCQRCWSDQVTWIDSAGYGIIYASSVINVPFQGIAEVPYAVGLVDLDEGVRLPCRLPAGRERPVGGDRVKADFIPGPAGPHLIFRRDNSGAGS
jgi:uncharacterized protein